MVPRCLISTDDQGHATVPVMNLSESNYAVKKGDTITRGVLFVESKMTIAREVNTELVQIQEITSDLDDDEVIRV